MSSLAAPVGAADFSLTMSGTTAPQLDALERGHILGQTVLVGRFGRTK